MVSEYLSTKGGKLLIKNSCKKAFSPNIFLKESSIEKCLEFAESMTSKEGYHNPKSFGGNQLRKAPEIYRDTLQGKLAELAFYNYMFKLKYPPDHGPDFEIYERGVWEHCDFTFNAGEINVALKSTKHFGNLLLLEKDRYNELGEYIEAYQEADSIKYHGIFLARIKGLESQNTPHDDLKKFEFEITGYITSRMFANAISNRKMLNQGIRIGGMPLKVNNYWFCASELKLPEQFVQEFGF